jgi:hypothetical protein
MPGAQSPDGYLLVEPLKNDLPTSYNNLSYARSDGYIFGEKEVNTPADGVISQANVILGQIMLRERHHSQNGPPPDQDELLAFLRKN